MVVPPLLSPLYKHHLREAAINIDPISYISAHSVRMSAIHVAINYSWAQKIVLLNCTEKKQV